jgi:hypothetical protein
MDDVRELRRCGITLMATAATGVFVLLHHPTAADSDAATLAERIAHIGPLARWVHGAIMAVAVVQLIALLRVALWLRGMASLSAAVLTSLGTLAMLGAGLVNGFVAIRLAERDDVSANAWLWAINQTLANSGVVALALAMIAWGIALRTRALGLATSAALAGIAGSLGMLGGAISLNVTGMAASYAVYAAWLAALGFWLWRSQR